MSRIHLTPNSYHLLQDFVHKGHGETFEILRELLDLQPAEAVVEVGCGTGLLASHFVMRGYDYWGIDLDPERIAAAKALSPEGNFLTLNALDIAHAPVPSLKKVYIHGMLHHVSETKCRQIIDSIMSLRPDPVLAVIEPFTPDPWWGNALGAFFAKMDAGKYIQTLAGWKRLFSPYLESYAIRSLWPRWPVQFIDARLVNRSPNKTG